MLIPIFYILDLMLLGSCLWAFHIRTNEQLVSLSLLQVLAGLPLLAVQYLYFAHHLEVHGPISILFTAESVFAVLLLAMAWRLSRPDAASKPESGLSTVYQMAAGGLPAAAAIYVFTNFQPFFLPDGALTPLLHRALYFYSLALLVCMLAAAWRTEVFWRSLIPSKRWEAKFLVVGIFVVCAALAWTASYRITYRRLVDHHFILLAALLFSAWLMMAYATARHRLLNRKIFISRKVVYSFVAPTIFGAYLFALGLVSLIMKSYGFALPDVLFGLALAAGMIAIGLFLCSQKIRHKVHFFISTHFYNNKYEFRDEWLALSGKLHGAKTEAEAARALYLILNESFYTTHIVIWLGDDKSGYATILQPNLPEPIPKIASQDPLVGYLERNRYLDIEKNNQEAAHHQLVKEKKDFFSCYKLSLLAPLKLGDQLVGVIGLGPEYTGGRYGKDDYDLLDALGTQTASAIIAIRSSEALAEARERKAWERLSAFVLHDIKNAATMLSLVRVNAGENIHRPEFQQDMLEALDDALIRMAKVQQRLNMLQEEIVPAWAEIELYQFLNEQCLQIRKRLGISISLTCPHQHILRSDPKLLTRILENLLLNSLQAAGGQPKVQIGVRPDILRHQIEISITDNGPGIAPELLPDDLFMPLKTTKPDGSGIGLWQVKQLVTNLGGTIQAENIDSAGACFTIYLPLSSDPLLLNENSI